MHLKPTEEEQDCMMGSKGREEKNGMKRSL